MWTEPDWRYQFSTWLSAIDSGFLHFVQSRSYTNRTCARNVQYPLLFVVFAVTPFMALVLTTNTPSPPLFFPPLFSILAPLSTWNVLWHLWNGDPGVWQASPVETQRHEKEGQALLALRAACTYCTFIQIAHINCNLDVGFGWFPFRLFFVCFIPT